MKTFLFLFAMLICHFGVHAQPGEPLFQCPGNIEEYQLNPGGSASPCNTNFSNFIANHGLELVPVNSPTNLRINLNIIFVQNSAGIGNFQVGNPEHMAHYNAAVDVANAKLSNLLDNSSNTTNGCACSTQPDFYPSAYIELVPHFVEVKSDYYFDHMNDPVVNGVGSIFNTSRPFLTEIVDLAKLQPSYAPGGINYVITNHGTAIIDLLNSPPGVAHWQIPSLTEPFHGYVIADLPSFNLNKDMIIHFPDGFLRYLGYVNFYAPNNEWWINGDWIPAVGQLLAHEVLHFLDLSDINDTTTCPENIMNNAGDNDPELKLNLTGCQLRKVFQAFYTKTSRTAIICEDALESDLIVDQNEIWSNNLRILGNVIVKNGYTLTVTCEVHMSPGGRIIVERGGRLVVDGGLLTGDCQQYWKGIVVEGDAPGHQTHSGIVELKNSAIIQHARDAISMNPSHLPWSDTYHSYFGGIVRGENSTIRHCYRGVEFMRYGYGGYKDVSYFNNLTFEDLAEGMTDWADDGVTFDHCTFRNIAKRGIHPYDSEVIVKNGTTFNNMPIGVDVITTFPIIFSSKIGSWDANLQRNEFNCQLYGVYAKAGGNSEPLSIVRNDFAQSTVGFHQDGNGQFWVEYNNFSTPGRGVQFYDCGFNSNLVKVNRFNSAHIGANSNKVNTGLQYWGNCFQNNSGADINNQNGNIFPYQGNMLTAAGNCFEGPAIDIDNKTGTSSLFYFVNAPTTSCKYPKNSTSYNYFVWPISQDDPYADCANLPFSVPESPCEIPDNATIANLIVQRQQIQAQIYSLSNQYSPGSWELNYWTEAYRECIQKIDDLVGRKSFDLESVDSLANKDAAINYFNGCGDFMNKTTAYGIMVTFGEYNRARTYLESLEVQNIDESNFKWVQGINLDYLQNMFEYSLVEEDRLRLEQIGRADGSLNGYARSLYEVLTGERIEVNFAEPEGSGGGERGQNAGWREDLTVSTFPNPVRNGRLSIAVSGITSTGTLRSELFDLSGRQSAYQSIVTDGTFSMDVSSLPDGVYFLKVSNTENEVLYQTKVVIFE